MARPREFDLDDAEEALLGAFWRSGYASTSLQDLCDATGLKHASLYAAFGPKDAMFRRALARYQHWLAQQMATDANGLAAIEFTLDTVVRLTIDDPERRGCPMINAIAEGKLSSEASDACRTGIDSMRRLMRRYAKDASPGRPAPELDHIAAILVAATVSIRVLGRASATAATLRYVADGAMTATRTWCAPARSQ